MDNNGNKRRINYEEEQPTRIRRRDFDMPGLSYFRLLPVYFRFKRSQYEIIFLGPSNSNSTSSRNRLNPQSSNDQRDRSNQNSRNRDGRIEITRNNYIIDDLRNSDANRPPRQHSQVSDFIYSNALYTNF